MLKSMTDNANNLFWGTFIGLGSLGAGATTADAHLRGASCQGHAVKRFL